MKANKAKWIADNGHAWLIVPMELARQVSGISEFSYQSPNGSKAYLEEDCDAYRYIEHYGEDAIELDKPTQYAGTARCRNYPRYNQTDRGNK
jgi:hypothetical protein